MAVDVFSVVAPLIFSQSTSGAGAFDWGLYVSSNANPSRSFKVYLNTTSGQSNPETVADIYVDNVPILWTFTYDGAFLRMYANNKSVITPVAKTGNINKNGASIGFDYWNSSYMNFNLYYAGILNRALSASEVESLYFDPYQFLIPA